MDENSTSKTSLIMANIGMWAAQALYTISPIDLLPDVIPGVGLIDDVFLLGLSIAFTVYTFKKLRAAREARQLGSNGTAPVLTSEDGGQSYEPLSLEELKAW